VRGSSDPHSDEEGCFGFTAAISAQSRRFAFADAQTAATANVVEQAGNRPGATDPDSSGS